MIFLNLLLLMVWVNATAQPDLPAFTLEAGMGGGGMNCLTDLGGRAGAAGGTFNDIDLSYTKGTITMYANALYKQRIGLSAMFFYGAIAAADNRGNRTAAADMGSLRNLSFRSFIAETDLALNLRVLHSWWYEGNGTADFSISVKTGAGWFFFRPKALLHGRWQSLHPLRLEGQGFAEYPGASGYRLSQLNIPAGILMSRGFAGGARISVGFDYRFLFTDYLDDVSGIYIDPVLFGKYLDRDDTLLAAQLQYRAPVDVAGPVPVHQARGNPKKNDAYFSITLKLGVMIGS